MPVIGFLHSAAALTFAEQIPAFHKGLSEAGYVDGQNVTVEYRRAENQTHKLNPLATELMGQRVCSVGNIRRRNGGSGSTEPTCDDRSQLTLLYRQCHRIAAPYESIANPRRNPKHRQQGVAYYPGSHGAR